MFETLIVSRNEKNPRNRSTWLISGALHLGIVAALLVMPLIRYSTLTAASPLTYLAALPAIETPLPPKLPTQPRRSEAASSHTDPVVVWRSDPKRATKIPEAPEMEPGLALPGLSTEPADGIPGGYPGIPEGLSGSLELGLRGELPELPPPPPKPAAPEPLRVGGSVQHARKIVHVQPVYPELARRARVEGVVLIEALVSELGSVERVRILRGHPLLNGAALEAVRQWKYSPTLLNGEPISVVTTISVVFSLRSA